MADTWASDITREMARTRTEREALDRQAALLQDALVTAHPLLWWKADANHTFMTIEITCGIQVNGRLFTQKQHFDAAILAHDKNTAALIVADRAARDLARALLDRPVTTLTAATNIGDIGAGGTIPHIRIIATRNPEDVADFVGLLRRAYSIVAAPELQSTVGEAQAAIQAALFLLGLDA